MLYVLLALGFVLLVAGGELLVRGAVALATRLGVSPLLVGLTVVGFGTSTPELVTSLQAAFTGAPGIAVGNVVGSNIANILLILGVAALIYPVAVERGAFRRDGTALVLATLAGGIVILSGSLARPGGAILLAGLVAYIVLAYRSERTIAPIEGPTGTPAAMATGPAVALAVLGIALTILGARFLIQGATGIATAFGVSETVIGLTVVAVGTSLPELVTAVIAGIKRQGDIAFGNVVGSNIYNILGILGVTALVKPIEVPPQIAGLDVWVMGAATLALLAVSITGWRVTRREGIALIAAYAAYLGWLALAG